ncbi:MAG: hypothetical protein ACI9DM_002192 [Cyclobacteriaceae bacterium]|jgi:hypothetical protein
MILGDTIYYMWAEDDDEIDNNFPAHDYRSGYTPRLGTLLHWGSLSTQTLIQDVYALMTETVAIIVDTEIGLVREISPDKILTLDSIAMNQYKEKANEFRSN